MKTEDFTISANKGGYTIYYKGQSIGGAGTMSKGANIRGKAAIKQAQDYWQDAKRDIEALINGNGYPHMKLNIEKIDAVTWQPPKELLKTT